MEPKEDDELEYWEIPEKKEGYDVYQYDAPTARKGQLLTALIFIIALAAFALAVYMSSQHPSDRRERIHVPQPIIGQ